MSASGGGEADLIGAVARVLGRAARGEGVERGIGDDAAVLVPPAGGRLVATVDMVVEGQHFVLRGPAAGSLADVGRRALAVNLSDVAAMGARPLWALCSLGLPEHVGRAEVEALYAGLRDLASAHGVAVVGGNLARVAERLVVDICLVGHADRPLLRGGARPGDLLMVTGRVGASAAGLALARSGIAEWPGLRGAWLRPEPRVREGLALAALPEACVRSACDVSDGLAVDAARLCGPGTALTLWAAALPIPAEARAAARRLSADATAWALHGGEDYELALAVPPEAEAVVAEALRAPGMAGAHTIGAFSAGGGGVSLAQGPGAASSHLPASGWDPFTPAAPPATVREGQDPGPLG